MIRRVLTQLLGVISGVSVTIRPNMTSAAETKCIRLSGVVGKDDRKNDLLYLPGSNAGTVVYFGGDVQELPEIQGQHRDNKRYMEWNLEETALLLSQAFSQNIIVVRPSRMELKTFSCYDNFVESDLVGSPSHSQNSGARDHLKALMSSTAKALNLDQQSLLPVTLLGFSKGVVVLNQIVHELASSAACDWLKIDTMCWLDGGHNGGKLTWITDKSLLSILAESGIKVRVRVTPYQINDTRRPWIKAEEKIFSRTLERLGCNIVRTFYFNEEEATIENHFKILNSLKNEPLS